MLGIIYGATIHPDGTTEKWEHQIQTPKPSVNPILFIRKKPMNIQIKPIPHKQHRYSTCGDWFFEPDGTLTILVSEEMDPYSQQLVALHELAEVLMCKANGITQKDVDEFDMNYEANRADGDESEPGDSPRAPYNKQHSLATAIERTVCAQMGIAWADHEQQVNKLFE